MSAEQRETSLLQGSAPFKGDVVVIVSQMRKPLQRLAAGLIGARYT